MPGRKKVRPRYKPQSGAQQQRNFPTNSLGKHQRRKPTTRPRAASGRNSPTKLQVRRNNAAFWAAITDFQPNPEPEVIIAAAFLTGDAPMIDGSPKPKEFDSLVTLSPPKRHPTLGKQVQTPCRVRVKGKYVDVKALVDTRASGEAFVDRAFARGARLAQWKLSSPRTI